MPVRVFGRRASDRRYNLAYFENKALYSIGPNIVIQALDNAASQELLSVDPSRFSYFPQISTFHYAGERLAAVTEQ